MLGQVGFNPFVSEAVSEYIKIVAQCLYYLYHCLTDKINTHMCFLRNIVVDHRNHPSLAPPPVYIRAAGGFWGNRLRDQCITFFPCVLGHLRRRAVRCTSPLIFPSCPSSTNLLTTVSLHFNAWGFLLLEFSSP